MPWRADHFNGSERVRVGGEGKGTKFFFRSWSRKVGPVWDQHSKLVPAEESSTADGRAEAAAGHGALAKMRAAPSMRVHCAGARGSRAAGARTEQDRPHRIDLHLSASDAGTRALFVRRTMEMQVMRCTSLSRTRTSAYTSTTQHISVIHHVSASPSLACWWTQSTWDTVAKNRNGSGARAAGGPLRRASWDMACRARPRGAGSGTRPAEAVRGS